MPKPAKLCSLVVLAYSLFHHAGAVFALELSMINGRRAEGQAKAREAGKHMGRHAKLTPEQVATISNRAKAGESRALTVHFERLSSDLIGSGLTSMLMYAATVTADRNSAHGIYPRLEG